MKRFLSGITFFFLSFSGQEIIAQDVRINEVMSSNSTSVFDENGDTPDWIEIYNAGNGPVNLAGYGISDDNSDPFKWIFPEITLASQDHLIVFASGKNRTGQGQWETTIDWGDNWKYYVPQSELPGNWRALGYNDASWPTGMSGFGYGDNDDNTIVGQTMSVYIRKTFSLGQMPVIMDAMLHVDYDDGFVAYLNGQEIARANLGTPGSIPAFNEPALQVTEPLICYGGNPMAFPVSPSLLFPENNVLAIEVHNFDLGSSDLTLIPFFSLLLEGPPPNPNGTPPVIRLTDPMMHTNFKISSPGETIYLTDPSGILIDSLQTGNLPIDVSRGRQPDGSGNWCFFDEATPGLPNSTSCWPAITNQVQFSLPGGFYSGITLVELFTADPADVIYYTVDGTAPDGSAPEYTNPFTLTGTTVVRAIAVHEGYLPGRSVTNTYFINAAHDLPVFSISTDPDNLFDPAIGIYHENNIWQDWERPIHIEFYDTNDISGFSIDAGVKIFGGWTRTLPQKSLAIYARESYGYGEVEYPLFPDLPYDNYESFVLRNSGNDWQNTMFRDGLMTGLVAEDGLDLPAFRPAVVYINGDYWGIHNIREKMNDRYIKMHHGMDSDSLDLLEIQQNPLNGDAVHYQQMIAYIETHPMSLQEHYEYIKTRMDVANFITYQVSQIYFANTDWPGNNIKYWRPRTIDGKWKWILYDTDFGFGLVENYTHNTLFFATDPAGPDWPNPPWSTFLLRELLTNFEFKVDFINRYADLLNSSFRQERILQHIDLKKNLIQGEMPKQFERWGSNMWEWLSNIQVMQLFASQRKSHVQNHVIQHFDLTGDSQVTLDVVPASSGRIRISTLEINDLPWTGEYFNGVPVKLEATANPGYKFIRWEGSISSDTAAITVFFNGNKTLTAVFEAYDPDLLVINEINYNSSPDFNTEDWIEIFNPNGYQVSLENWSFKDEDDAHVFNFSEGDMIGSNGFLVLCADKAAFHSLFPDVMNYTGNLDFGLNGAGELIRLFDFSGLLIDSVHYDDAGPWPEEPDGNGPTLELIDPEYDNALPESWNALGQHGTPGNPNGIYITVPADHEPIDLDLRIVPNPASAKTNLLIISGSEQDVKIEIYNYSGFCVWYVPSIHLGLGTHQITWDVSAPDGSPVSSGIYFCRISSEKQSIIRKLVIVN